MSAKTAVSIWDWDVRVRERNMRNGILSEKDVDKMLSSLADVADKSESLGLTQPAMLAGDWDE